MIDRIVHTIQLLPALLAALLPALLTALVCCAPAAAGQTPRPALEIVVTRMADGQVMVGVGEPPSNDRIAALVYSGAPVPANDSVTIAGNVDALAAAAGGTVGLRLYDAPKQELPPGDDLLDHLSPRLPAGLAYTRRATAADARAQITADAGGYHRRDDPGRPAATASEAMAQFVAVIGHGSGHAEAAYEPRPGGGMVQTHAATWDRDVAGFTCPFPVNPASPPPPGLVLELALADGVKAREEALATWCDVAARGLIAECGADELMTLLEAGAATARFAEAPDAGRWWLPLIDVAAAGSMTADPCLAAGLAGLDAGNPHAGLSVEIRLVEDDLASGCGKAIEERCN